MIPSLIQLILAFIIATGIGGVSAILGLGGGFLAVPTLTLLFGLDLKTAIGTSLAVAPFTALSGGIVYGRQGRLCWKTIAVAAVPCMAGSLIGAFLTGFVSDGTLTLLFGAVMLILAAQMVLPGLSLVPAIVKGPSFCQAYSSDTEELPEVRMYYLHLGIWGLVAGAMSGATGLSSGIAMVSAMISGGLPVHAAVGTSMAIIFATSSTGALAHIVQGNYSLQYFVSYAIGVSLGAFAGAQVAARIPARTIQLVFGFLIAAIGIFMMI
ncbi:MULTISPECIES: sulfite exporter TauE/SafE family protein [unclassified Methanoculleus]|jgi:hypothetical protein|uniref:sulfite exporter TauE/SafE family protein n=1 Tax=unclassified Methanoculleus TaxID=2619537 RepID=UPI00319DC0A2